MMKTLLATLGVLAAVAAAADKQTAPVAPAKQPETKAAEQPAQTENMFEKEVQAGGETKTLKLGYVLFVPPECGKTSKRCPLILFLHGAGERGDKLELVKKHGPPKLVEKDRGFEFIVVSPQCSRGRWWPQEDEALMALLEDIMARYPVDKDRVYLTGLSMGGFGTWSLAAQHPDRFAAIVPICGGGSPADAEKLKDIPAWVFHGGKDRTVNVKKSQEMVDAIQAAGGKDIKLTIYPDAGHDSWSETYANPELYKWMLEHKLSDRAAKTKADAKQPAAAK